MTEYASLMRGFVGFFVIVFVVTLIMGALQQASGYNHPESTGRVILTAIVLSFIGTILLNIGLRAFMPNSGPGVYVVI